MNLHAKAFSYSMEPCVRILCVRAGTVELRVGRPLLLFFGAPRESCFFSAGLNSVMQDHARACAHACVCVSDVSFKRSGGCIFKSMHGLFGVSRKRHVVSV